MVEPTGMKEHGPCGDARAPFVQVSSAKRTADYPSNMCEIHGRLPLDDDTVTPQILSQVFPSTSCVETSLTRPLESQPTFGNIVYALRSSRRPQQNLCKPGREVEQAWKL